MERQILKRRNSDYTLFKSQRELEPQRRQLLKANQWADQAQRERIHLCSRFGMKDPTFIKNAVQEVAEKLKNWKDAGVRKEITPPKKKREEFPMQHDQESRTVSLLSDQRRKLPE